MVRGRWTLVVSLLLLQSFTLGAGLYVWTTGFTSTTPPPRPPRSRRPTRTPVPLITAEAVLASGSEGTAVTPSASPPGSRGRSPTPPSAAGSAPW